MTVRLLRLDHAGDVEEVRRLTGRVLESATTGWAAVRPDGFCEVGQLPDLALSAHSEIRAGAQRLMSAPPPLLLRGRTFDWCSPVVMGIVNVTPDSFSDGGRFLDPQRAIEQARQLLREGAAILDVGGESTRPKGKTYGAGAVTVSVEEEIARVVPVIRGIRAVSEVPISIDTRKAQVAAAALSAGADLVNDVTGLIHDPGIVEVVAKHEAALVLMHTPADIELLEHEQPSGDILGDVLRGLERSLSLARRLPAERLIVDPGIGFGKTLQHNLYLLRQLGALRALGHAVLVGASRKASIARAAAGDEEVPPPSERVASSVAAAVMAYLNGAHLLRVHDVRATVEALRVAAAIRQS